MPTKSSISEKSIAQSVKKKSESKKLVRNSLQTPVVEGKKWKHAGGRPSKLKGFLVGMKKALEDGINAIILTDEELFIQANLYLEEKDRIWYSTFKTYKDSEQTEEKEWYDQFLALYKTALLTQKRNLFIKLQGDETQWQKYAWIIERKFSEWNLRIKTENKNENTNKNLNVNWSLKDKSDEELTNLLLGALK